MGLFVGIELVKGMHQDPTRLTRREAPRARWQGRPTRSDCKGDRERAIPFWRVLGFRRNGWR
jgi:hypothetical protein